MESGTTPPYVTTVVIPSPSNHGVELEPRIERTVVRSSRDRVAENLEVVAERLPGRHPPTWRLEDCTVEGFQIVADHHRQIKPVAVDKRLHTLLPCPPIVDAPAQEFPRPLLH